MAGKEARKWNRLSWRARVRAKVVGLALAGVVAVTSPALAQQPAPRKPTGPIAPVRPTTNANNPAATRPGSATKAAVESARVAELKVMAVVNGEQITRDMLGKESLRRYGDEVLESLINRTLIANACAQSGIRITDKDVELEVNRVAQKFGLTVENWVKLLKEERGISIEQYKKEIIWPTIALRQLAAEQIQVSPEELKKAWETEYGPRVRVRVIGTSNERQVREAHAAAKAKPENFSELAKRYCEDPNIASVGGAIPPIRKHLGDAALERVAFSLKPGQVSEILHVQNQYFILLCEGQDPERFVDPQYRDQIEESLAERIRDTKLRTASAELFEQLQKQAQVTNVYNNPQLSKQHPGVAALIAGKPITLQQLADECILRHGREVLEGEINRKLLMQELKKKNLVVTQADENQEIARAAVAYGCVKADGSPDLEKWLKQVQEQDGATVELYRADAVWPSVALKKIVGDRVEVTDEDLRKGFESNYGPRVEVLAIVVGDQRTAQRVWELARQNPTDEYFGQLAAEYSIEPVSKGNAGKVPPVRKFGGQPIVENEAFKLKQGDLSSLLAVGDKFIILRCLGRTQPVVTKLQDVQDELAADLLEKKLSAEMTRSFDEIHRSAQIDNFLAGTSQAAKRATPALTSPAGGAPATKGPSARVGSLPGKNGK